MAKVGVLRSSDLSMESTKAVAELKKELQSVVKAIVDDDDVAEDEAVRVLSSLKDWKLKRPTSFQLDDNINLTVPEEFKCPISRELMRDPVFLATGLTYDRPFIERWLKEGHKTCPQTQQALSHTVLTPNHLVQEMISQWCSDHGVELPRPSHEADENPFGETDAGQYLDSLLEKISSPSSSDRKEAARELRTLTEKIPAIRALFGEAKGRISTLVQVDVHPDLQEDLITTLLNLSIPENNRSLMVENESLIALLVESLKSGSQQTKSNAAGALFALSDTNSGKLIIGNAGAIKPLIDLLAAGNKDAASAMFSLCTALENKRRAVHEGAVQVIVSNIEANAMVPESLAILALLSGHQRAVEEMDERNAVSLLLGVLRESSCEESRENCIAILYTVCYNDRAKLREIAAEEKRNGAVSMLARSGTSRARRKASGILDRINRPGSRTHTA